MPESLTLLVQVVLPVFAVIAVGASVGSAFRLEVVTVNRLALYALLPALVFRSLSELTLAEIPAARLIAGYLLFVGSVAAITWTLGARLARPSRRALVGTSMLGNAANMNLPIVLFALGQPGLERGLILYVASVITMYLVGPVLFGGALSVGRVARTIATFPVLWAAIAGIVAARVGFTLPAPVGRAVGLLADAAIPMMLLILGVQLVRAGRWRPTGRVWTSVAFKLGLAPLVAFGAGAVVGLRGIDLATLTLLGAMPTAVNAVMLTLEFGGDARQVGDSVALGTLSALVTLPIVLALVTRLA